MAMEDVAGKAEELAKAKVKDNPPPPFRKRKTHSISKFTDPKKYATDGNASRDKQAQQRHIRVFWHAEAWDGGVLQTHGRNRPNDKSTCRRDGDGE